MAQGWQGQGAGRSQGLSPARRVRAHQPPGYGDGVGSWRRLPTDQGPEPTPLAEGLDRVLRSLGVGVPDGPAGASIDVVTTVFDRWGELVGEHLVDHVRPLAVQGTTLVVVVTEPAWASQLRWLAPDLCATADHLIAPGAITTVEVRVRPEPDART